MRTVGPRNISFSFQPHFYPIPSTFIALLHLPTTCQFLLFDVFEVLTSWRTQPCNFQLFYRANSNCFLDYLLGRALGAGGLFRLCHVCDWSLFKCYFFSSYVVRENSTGLEYSRLISDTSPDTRLDRFGGACEASAPRICRRAPPSAPMSTRTVLPLI